MPLIVDKELDNRKKALKFISFIAMMKKSSKVEDPKKEAKLFADLAAAHDVPVRTVSGFAYNGKHFVFHTWNELFIGNAWLEVDTVYNSYFEDGKNLRIVVGGNLEAMAKLVGKIKIELVK